jgi:hypothetical protein
MIIVFHFSHFISNGGFFCETVANDSNRVLGSLAILAENISYYFVLRYLITMQKQYYAVLSKFTKPVKIQLAFPLVFTYSHILPFFSVPCNGNSTGMFKGYGLYGQDLIPWSDF